MEDLGTNGRAQAAAIRANLKPLTRPVNGLRRGDVIFVAPRMCLQFIQEPGAGTETAPFMAVRPFLAAVGPEGECPNAPNKPDEVEAAIMRDTMPPKMPQQGTTSNIPLSRCGNSTAPHATVRHPQLGVCLGVVPSG